MVAHRRDDLQPLLWNDLPTFVLWKSLAAACPRPDDAGNKSCHGHLSASRKLISGLRVSGEQLSHHDIILESAMVPLAD